MSFLQPIRAAAALPTSSLPVAGGAEKVARDFEAIFAGQLAKLMLESVSVDSQFGGGHGEEMFRGMLAERLGEEITRNGSFGLKAAVLAQIQQIQDQMK
ncbi:flagellar biosynthesis protein FlgJ [Sphingomonas ginkgonis]|uniref:Flagellar biosynthesis protein FlgJ n=1 Tax=Sphingomonas ginkgonis TaxID=2315330 RepID=A0A429V9U2_9SPHN|nr:rod-binding protein [Sphingomonas ginkgonis]RST30714.1 flagellar biosynthesis protein FlgJ [Sphingomonas ginkgonis]